MLIAIDPGASGGIAWTDNDGMVQAVPMPEGMTAQADMLRDMLRVCGDGTYSCIIERVGTYMPGNSGPSAATFAEHVGALKAMLYCLGIAIADSPTPAKWMKALGHGVNRYLPDGYKDMPERDRKKARSAAKRQNKAAIKEDMARRYPHLTVTLKTADALGMLTYWMAA